MTSPEVSEETRRLWMELADHLAECAKPIAACQACAAAYGLEPVPA